MSKFQQRNITALVAGAVALQIGVVAPSVSGAAEFPEGTIRIILPQTSGGPVDLAARLVAEGLQKRLNRAVIVEARPGAGGNLGLGEAARSKPDGMTLAFTGETSVTVNPHIFQNMPFDVNKDIKPVAQFGSYGVVFVVGNHVKANSLQELVAAAKVTPFKAVSGGYGGVGHLSMEQFAYLQGLKMLHVPYKGQAPSVVAIIAGDGDGAIASIGAFVPQIQAGQVKALGVGDEKRHPLLPNVPTFAEQGITGFKGRFGYFLLAPSGMPDELVAEIEKHVPEIMSAPGTKEKFESAGIDPTYMLSKEATAVLRDRLDFWGRIVKTVGIKVE